jgi:inhibitor of cysteine peptidase
MPKKLLAIFLSMISLFGLSIFATNSVSASEFTTTSGVDSSHKIANSEISIDNSDNGTTVQLKIGESLIINLASTKSTGFSWQLNQINASVLEFVSSQYITPTMPGAPGTEVWIFNAVGVGTSAISMEYIRLFSGTVGGTFDITVNVTPPQSVGGEVTSVNTLGVLAPLLFLACILSIGGTVILLRQRKGS